MVTITIFVLLLCFIVQYRSHYGWKKARRQRILLAEQKLNKPFVVKPTDLHLVSKRPGNV